MEIDKETLKKLETPNNSDIQKIEIIPIANLENSAYKCIEKLKCQYHKNGKTYYGYYLIIQCKHCGALKKIGSADWSNYTEKRECIHCKNEKTYNDFVGFENDAYKVIAFDHKQREKNKLFYKVKCKKCGSELVMRKDAILAAKDKGCIKCRGNNHIPTTAAPINVYYGHYKHQAKSRGFNFNLTNEEFDHIVHQNCYYCGTKPVELESLKRYNKTGSPIYINGVDRINSNLGYSVDNCVPCCTVCNRMKLDYSLSEFYDHIHKIFNHMKSSTIISKESTAETNAVGKGGSPMEENDMI